MRLETIVPGDRVLGSRSAQLIQVCGFQAEEVEGRDLGAWIKYYLCTLFP